MVRPQSIFRLAVIQVIAALLVSAFSPCALAGTVTVQTEGSCAIVGMTAEQARHVALQRARAAAIERAGGVRVTSSSLVTDSSLVADFIKSFSRGFVVEEKVSWLPLDEYRQDAASHPVPVYGLELTATVVIPERSTPRLGLKAKLNRSVFREGEKASLSIHTRKPARIAVFNIMADDQAVLLFPTGRNPLFLSGQSRLVLPEPRSGLELVMATLPKHQRDAEGFLVAALPADCPASWLDSFESGNPMAMPEFFAAYALLADWAEELILPYEVFSEDKP
jgi:hypothetical protein